MAAMRYGNLKQVKKVFTGIREREERLDLVCLKLPFTSTLKPPIHRNKVYPLRWH